MTANFSLIKILIILIDEIFIYFFYRELQDSGLSCASFTFNLFLMKSFWRAHASKIMNVFSSVVDALDKDPELVAIKKIVAEGD